MVGINGDRLRYEEKTVKAVRGTEGRSLVKWEADGWELVGQDTGKLTTEMRFRRPRPRPPLPRARILTAAGVLAVIVLVGFVSLIVAEDPDNDPETNPASGPATPSSSATPERSPSPDPSTSPSGSSSGSPSASASPEARQGAGADGRGAGGGVGGGAGRVASAGQVEAAFEEFFAERSDADVVIAQAVTEVVLLGPVLRVTFDPAEVGLSRAEFDAVNPFNNPYDRSESLADFVAAAVTSSSNRDLRVRRAVEVIVAVDANSQIIGQRLMADIVRLNGLPT